MTWNNAQCQLLLHGGQVLRVSAQGAVLYAQVPHLPPASADLQPLFAAAARVLVLYAPRRHYKAHLAALRAYLARGTITCRFERLEKAQGLPAGEPSLREATLQLDNGDGDRRLVTLSAKPERGDFPLCLLLNADEIEQAWTCTVLAACIGDAIAELRSDDPCGSNGAADAVAL